MARQSETVNPLIYLDCAPDDLLVKERLIEHLFNHVHEFVMIDSTGRDLVTIDQQGQGDPVFAANIFVILVSETYLKAPNAITSTLAARLAREKTLSILPILVEPCDWKATWIANYQVLPKNLRPLMQAGDQEQAFDLVAGDIAKAIKLWRNDQAITRIRQEWATRSGKLVLSDCSLDTMPMELLNMRWLKELDLSNNALTKIEQLENLSSLIILNLSHNRLAKIENLSQLRALQHLDLGHNHLQRIENLGSLYQLEFLQLHHNQLRIIEQLKNKDRLRYLGLSYNLIQTVINVGHLRSLRIFRARYNQLRDVSGLARLNKLELVVLNGNELTSLEELMPLILRGLPVYLEESYRELGIYVGQNKLSRPGYEVIEKGNAAILSYFKNLEIHGSGRIEILKLILVGNSRSGKTDLSEFLRTKRIGTHPSTHLLDIQRWKTTFSTRQGATTLWINIFDFGGQDYYHDAHRLFYSQDTGYILLWEQLTDRYQELPDEGEGLLYENFPLAYWLESISYQLRRQQLIGDGPEVNDLPPEIAGNPVLILQNKIDLGGAFVDQVALAERYPNIWGFLDISLKHDKRTAVLQEVLIDYINDLQPAGRTLVSYQLKVVEYFLRSDRSLEIYNLAEFCAECTRLANKKGVVIDQDNGDILAEILNNMGLIYYHRKTNGGGIIYSEISRLNELIKAVMDEAKKRHEKGIFDTRQLTVAHREQVIQLLCDNHSIISVGQERYLAPQFLPKEPDTSLNFLRSAFKNDQVRFVYRAYFHKSLLLSLFAKYIQGMVNDPSIDLHTLPIWRDGILISRGAGAEQQMVLVEFEKNAKEGMIHIKTMKPYERAGLEQDIVATLDELSRGWTVEKQISADSQHYFSIAELKAGLGSKQYQFHSRNQVFSINDFKHIEAFQHLPKKLFISYSSHNAEYVKRFITHLQVLRSNGIIEPWYDRMIESGTRWDEAIRKEMAQADVVIFLLSPDFLATEYIMQTEIPLAIANHRQERSKFFFIELQPCGWARTVLAQFQQTDDPTTTEKSIITIGQPDDDAQWNKVIDELVATFALPADH